jgi:hypothetical protein
VKSQGILLLHLWNQTIEVQHEFLCGIPEGFVTFLDTEGQFAGDRRRTNLYINLLVNWREIAVMQKAEPPKSRRDLQQWLIVEAKIPMSRDADWFDHLCDEIGLSMKGSVLGVWYFNLFFGNGFQLRSHLLCSAHVARAQLAGAPTHIAGVPLGQLAH